MIGYVLLGIGVSLIGLSIFLRYFINRIWDEEYNGDNRCPPT